MADSWLACCGMSHLAATRAFNHYYLNPVRAGMAAHKPLQGCHQRGVIFRGLPLLTGPTVDHSPGTQRLLKKSRPSYLSLSCTPEPSTPSPSEDTHILSQPQSVCRGCSPPQTPGRCSKPLPPIPLQTDSCSIQSLDNAEYFTNSDESCRLVADPKPVRFGLGRRSLRIHGQVNHAFSPPRKPSPGEPSTQRRVRRTQSGPAGSFNKPSFLNLQSKRNNHSTYKPEVPPPIPPRLHKIEDSRRWSVEVPGAYSDEDRPPKLPPRDPLSRGCSRTPSPKSLPLYVNGEMPPTQSFAPDPKYVYRGLQRQNSEGSPCIFPVIENGQKVSNTHYYLLDGPPAQNLDVSNSEWDYRMGYLLLLPLLGERVAHEGAANTLTFSCIIND
uniref:Mig-6 domain-containing protein n=1 Tax=Periophthalmus magnuspinnatus TaxID=409849 RepID=A0A3B4AGZ7_9GOBI